MRDPGNEVGRRSGPGQWLTHGTQIKQCDWVGALARIIDTSHVVPLSTHYKGFYKASIKLHFIQMYHLSITFIFTGHVGFNAGSLR